MSNKDEALQKLDQGYSEFKSSFAGLSDDEMSQVWLGQWCVKDIVAHVAGWHREMTGALERLGRGERPTPEGVDYSDPDPWNAGFASAQKGAPPSQVIGELDASFRGYRDAASALGEDRFEPGRTVDRILTTSGTHHYTEHGDQIRDWRKGK